MNETRDIRINNEVNNQKYSAFRRSSMIATLMIGFFGLLIASLFFIEEISTIEVSTYLAIFIGFGTINITAIKQRWSLQILNIIALVNVFFIYSFISYLLFNANLPGIFANLFLAFTVGYIYIDLRIASINHFLMALTSSLVLWIFPEVFGIRNLSQQNLIIINATVFLILAFLYVSALFNIRLKNFNYLKLAKSKENEYRIIEALFELQKEHSGYEIDVEVFHKDIERFFEAFSSKLKMDNIFQKRLDLIKDLETLDDKKIQKKYKDLPDEVFQELSFLTLKYRKRIRYLSYKISQIPALSEKIALKPDDLFNSLRHYNDSENVKIVVFSALYLYFRHDNIEFKGFSNDEFIAMLKASGLEPLIEPKIIKSFYKYIDVVNTIFNDAINGPEVAL